MDSVRIVNNFLTDEEVNKFDYIQDIYTIWSTKYKKNNNTCVDYWYIDKSKDPHCTEHILNKINSYFSKNFKIKSVEIVGKTYALSGDYCKEDDNTYTCLIYLTKFDIDKVDIISGCTEIENKNITMGVIPLCKRLLLFGSDITYRMEGASRFTNEILGILRYKLYI